MSPDVAADGPGPYRIQVAAELSGTAPATLRAWERRYGVPAPRRTSSAYRLYTAEDVALVRRMNELVRSGLAPSEAARAVLSAPGPRSMAPAAAVAGGPDVDGLDLTRDRIIAALERWDERAIDDELTRLSYLVDAQTFYGRVVSPLVIEVGKRWEDGTFSIAQEHLLSEKLELTLRASLRSLERHDGPHVLMACIDGDLHVLGLLGASLRFSGSGARVTVLGASTPPDALADAVRSMAPRLVGLSATRVPPFPKALFQEYGRACGSVRWVVGGAAAGAVASAVEKAGGIVAPGPSGAWSTYVREWLKGTR